MLYLFAMVVRNVGFHWNKNMKKILLIKSISNEWEIKLEMWSSEREEDAEWINVCTQLDASFR